MTCPAFVPKTRAALAIYASGIAGSVIYLKVLSKFARALFRFALKRALLLNSYPRVTAFLNLRNTRSLYALMPRSSRGVLCVSSTVLQNGFAGTLFTHPRFSHGFTCATIRFAGTKVRFLRASKARFDRVRRRHIHVPRVRFHVLQDLPQKVRIRSDAVQRPIVLTAHPKASERVFSRSLVISWQLDSTHAICRHFISQRASW